MKERPILFSAPMIRALLAGRKTQTRRLVRPQPERVPDWSCPGVDGLRFFGMTFAETLLDGRPPYPPELLERCPYGAPGDRLWVRETWQSWRQTSFERNEWEIEEDTDRLRGSHIEYAATSKSVGPWRPSIFMPRWASRITLVNTEVRLQRLHDITEEDAEAEGVEFFDGMYEAADLHRSAKLAGCSHEDARAWFAWAWDHINGDRAPWVTNPWVWAVSFPPVTP